MLIFNSKKRKEQEKLDYLNKYGVMLEEISSANNKAFSQSFYFIILKSLLIFFASYGSIVGVVSAFELDFNLMPVTACFLIISFIIALLYYSKLFFYLGYIFIFIAFFIGSVSGYFLVNSGFQYFINAVYSKYSDFFRLNSVREANIYIKNESLTVSIAMIFTCVFIAILLNITISNKMSVIGTFLVTFPIIEIALYIDLKPGFMYMLMLFVAYITIGILNRSDHFKLPSLKDTHKEYITYNRKKGIKYYYYLTNGIGMGLTTIYVLALTIIFLLFASGIFYNNYDSRIVNNKLKKSVDEVVKTYIQNGLSGFFDRYENTGGMNHGQLGGVSTVRQDFETDLIITYVPTNLSRVYLKSFIGNIYSYNSFLPDEAQNVLNPNAAYNPASKYALSEYTHPTNYLSKMRIENIDAGIDEHFPYDSIAYSDGQSIYYSHFAHAPNLISRNKAIIENYLSDSFNSANNVSEVVYDPYDTLYTFPSSFVCDSEYEDFIYENYTSITDSLKPTLDDICEEAGLYNIKNNGNDQEYRMAILEKLQAFYLSEFTYTLSPGSTPRNKDVVEFFLTEKRKGYCAHFASSAVMLLRNMNIPARYVEGYVIDYDNILDGVAIDTDTSLWNSYNKTKQKDQKVIQVDITDANAHAWVEVFIDDYGWIPFEFTVAAVDDAPIAGFSLGDLFSGLLIKTPNSETNDINAGNENDPKDNYNFSLSFGFITEPFIYILTFTIVMLTLISISGSTLLLIKIKIAEYKGQYKKATCLSFIFFSSKFKKKDKTINHFTLRDYEYYISEKLPSTPDSMHKEVFIILQKALYSNYEISKEEYKKYLTEFKLIRKNLK